MNESTTDAKGMRKEGERRTSMRYSIALCSWVKLTFGRSYSSPYARTDSMTRLLYTGDAPPQEQESNRFIPMLLGTPRLTLYSDHIADAVPDAELVVHTLTAHDIYNVLRIL